IYTADPRLDPEAEFLDRITYLDVLKRDLRVMDATAISMCRENDLPIVVFNIRKEGAVRSILAGEPVGSIVEG
nr:UMP kinase [Gemmatimonadota bacterium]